MLNFTKLIKNTKNEFENIKVNKNVLISKAEQIAILIFLLVIPSLISLIFFILSKTTSLSMHAIDIIESLNLYLVVYIIPVLGIFFCLIKNKSFLKETSFLIYLVWVFLLPITSNFINSSINRIEFNSYVSDSIYLVCNIIFFIFCLFLFFKNENTLIVSFKRWNHKNIIYFFVVVLVGFGIHYGLNFLLNLIQNTYDNSISNNQNSLGFDKNDAFSIVRIFIVAVIIAPIIEEIIYRYIIQNSFNNQWWSIFISTFVFAFAHINRTYDWTHILSYISLGLINGFIYFYFNNISLTIFLHFLSNLVAFILLF